MAWSSSHLRPGACQPCRTPRRRWSARGSRSAARKRRGRTWTRHGSLPPFEYALGRTPLAAVFLRAVLDRAKRLSLRYSARMSGLSSSCSISCWAPPPSLGGVYLVPRARGCRGSGCVARLSRPALAGPRASRACRRQPPRGGRRCSWPRPCRPAGLGGSRRRPARLGRRCCSPPPATGTGSNCCRSSLGVAVVVLSFVFPVPG